MGNLRFYLAKEYRCQVPFNSSKQWSKEQFWKENRWWSWLNVLVTSNSFNSVGREKVVVCVITSIPLAKKSGARYMLYRAVAYKYFYQNLKPPFFLFSSFSKSFGSTHPLSKYGILVCLDLPSSSTKLFASKENMNFPVSFSTPYFVVFLFSLAWRRSKQKNMCWARTTLKGNTKYDWLVR